MQTTKLISYLEDTKMIEWMHKNIPRQGQSEFIRKAVKEKVESLQKNKTKK